MIFEKRGFGTYFNASSQGSFHNAEGRPLINTARFRNLGSFNAYAHSKHVLTG